MVLDMNSQRHIHLRKTENRKNMGNCGGNVTMHVTQNNDGKEILALRIEDGVLRKEQMFTCGNKYDTI